MTSLAACHKTCHGVSSPEIGYYVPILLVSNLFLPFCDFYCSSCCPLIYYLFITCRELCISLKCSIKIKLIMKLISVPLPTSAEHRAYMIVFKCTIGTEANICVADDPFCSCYFWSGQPTSIFTDKNCRSSIGYWNQMAALLLP